MTEFSHVDPEGRARMVDVTAKPVTRRYARASVTVRMAPATLDRIVNQQVDKGNVMATARLAGIMAAKRVHELIPLCHQIPLDSVSVDFESRPETGELRIVAQSRAEARTGVEMEALTAASVAALTVYDMCKAVDRAMIIDGLALDEKRGGKSDYLR